jgi:Fur family zinc uptake transcriptional regulator
MIMMHARKKGCNRRKFIASNTGAYAILDLLREAGFSSQPPVAYRALDFLVEHGFAHKIERLNAFVGCALPDTVHSPAFMICRKCDTVAEAGSSLSNFNLSATASATGFKIEQTVVEARGVCNSCTERAHL